MTNNIKISNRLKTIGDLVLDNSSVVDVGCDHALLSIYLVINKNCKVIASDINKLPLKEAKKNIEKYNLEDKIKIVLSNGLECINDKFDTIVISGMGASTIINIIKKDIDKVRNCNKIIIESNNDLYSIRKYFLDNYFKIVNEVMVYDKGKYYTIIVFENSNKLIKYNLSELYFGEHKYRNSDIFIKYKNYLIDKYMEILRNKEVDNIRMLLNFLNE